MKLIHGTCLEAMTLMPNDSVDAFVTDPPFGIGFKYNQHKDQSNAKDYWNFFKPCYSEMLRIVKPGGLIAIWQTQIYFKYLWEWYGDDIHIYAACKNFVQLRKSEINYAYDPVVMTYKKGSKPLRPEKPRRNVDFFVANTAKIVSQKNAIEKGHPCPRPLDQVTEIVDNFTLPGGLILDPFMGSGTTGVACQNTGRHFIGIEMDDKYFSIAQERIGNAQVSLGE